MGLKGQFPTIFESVFFGPLIIPLALFQISYTQVKIDEMVNDEEGINATGD
jgi:hypothetical protein